MVFDLLISIKCYSNNCPGFRSILLYFFYSSKTTSREILRKLIVCQFAITSLSSKIASILLLPQGVLQLQFWKMNYMSAVNHQLYTFLKYYILFYVTLRNLNIKIIIDYLLKFKKC